MFKKIVQNFNGIEVVDEDAAVSLRENNTFMPGIKRVVFNLKTEDEVPKLDEKGNPVFRPAKNADGTPITAKDGKPIEVQVKTVKRLDKPILSTTVFFEDGSSVNVRNSKHDEVYVETRELPNGKKIEVASDCSKERAIAFAVVKRLLSKPNDNGFCESCGLGRILTKLVNSAYDQNWETAKTAYDKAVKKAEYEKTFKKAAEKPRRLSYDEVFQKIAPHVELLADALCDPEKISAIAEILSSKKGPGENKKSPGGKKAKKN